MAVNIVASVRNHSCDQDFHGIRLRLTIFIAEVTLGVRSSLVPARKPGLADTCPIRVRWSPTL